MREVWEALGRWAVTLCHCGIASRFPVAVPEAGGPCTGQGTGKAPYPVVGSRRHSQDTDALPCSVTGSCTLLGRTCCAVIFGGGWQQGGIWESASVSGFFLSLKDNSDEIFSYRDCSSTYISPSGESPGILDASSQPHCIWNDIWMWTQRCQNGEICLLKTYLLL